MELENLGLLRANSPDNVGVGKEEVKKLLSSEVWTGLGDFDKVFLLQLKENVPPSGLLVRNISISTKLQVNQVVLILLELSERRQAFIVSNSTHMRATYMQSNRYCSV